MFGQTAADLLSHYPSSLMMSGPSLAPPLPFLTSPAISPDDFGALEFESPAAVIGPELGYSTTSSCESYGSASCCTTQNPSFIQQQSVSRPSGRIFNACSDFEMINAFRQSHRPKENSLLNESQSIIDGMNKACRYSPEEKKERIERYKSKRTQRNFTKKIKYACRKTLADSRPRIRGRFARNDDTKKCPTDDDDQAVQYWNQVPAVFGGYDEDEIYNWANILDPILPN